MGETHLNSRLNGGKHGLNKDIRRVLLYWAELQLTTLDRTLRLNSRVCASPFQLLHRTRRKRNKDKGLYKSKYKVFTFPAKPVV